MDTIWCYETGVRDFMMIKRKPFSHYVPCSVEYETVIIQQGTPMDLPVWERIVEVKPGVMMAVYKGIQYDISDLYNVD